MRHLKRNESESSSSMADVAFLLLIFFLVSTTFPQDRGLMIKLPPDAQDFSQQVNERNLFKVLINAQNEMLVEGSLRSDLSGLSDEIKIFVLNNGKLQGFSDSPDKAIVSLKTSRGTDYFKFIEVLDELKKAYYEIYSERVGISVDQFRNLKLSDPIQAELYQKAKRGIPMNISIAEPN